MLDRLLAFITQTYEDHRYFKIVEKALFWSAKPTREDSAISQAEAVWRFQLGHRWNITQHLTSTWYATGSGDLNRESGETSIQDEGRKSRVGRPMVPSNKERGGYPSQKVHKQCCCCSIRGSLGEALGKEMPYREARRFEETRHWSFRLQWHRWANKRGIENGIG